MTHDEATAAIAVALHTIAPEADLSSIEADAPFREELDLDSLDFLNLVEALNDSTGVSIPEEHYARVGSLSGLVSYLVEHSQAVSA